MALDPAHVGRTYGPYRYTLGLEKMREYAYAVAGGIPALGLSTPPEGLTPLVYDEAVAKAGPYGSVIALPTFAVCFAIAPFGAALTDPAVGIDLLHLVHGEQDFEFFDVMREGDVMTTTGAITKIASKSGLDFITLETESKNQHDKRVVKGIWTAVIKAAKDLAAQ